MTHSKADIEAMAKQIRYDLSVTRSRVDQLMEAVASLPFPETAADAPTCPACGPLKAIQNEQQLAEHMENVHGRTPLLTNESRDGR